MKLVVTEYMSFDGLMEDPIWIAPYIESSFLKFKFDELLAADALLMGRKTYEYFLPVWASGEPIEDSPEQQGFANRVEMLPKYVVSSTLEAGQWNNSHIIRQDVITEIQALKQHAGGNLLMAGSATLLHALMAHNLVDEYRVLVFPVVVGAGKPLFTPNAQANLRLTSCEAFDSGVIALTYQPVG